VLVVGTGTGAEFATLGNRGASVYGIDVNREAVSIVRLKGRARGRSAAVAPCAASGGDRC
jgi:2-polyprenyl-3-methyl-5-hydroxy-6-metoxy-1,4-benzoquinol methylase